jgi:hypothetical protein
MTGKNFREAVGGLKKEPHPDHPDNREKDIDTVANMKKFREIKE